MRICQCRTGRVTQEQTVIDKQQLRNGSEETVRIAVTPKRSYGSEYSSEVSRILSRDDVRKAHDFCRRLPGYASTPLTEFPELANENKVASVRIKDEGQRTPTYSFKVLGPPYALACQLLSRPGQTNRNSMEVAGGMLRSDLQHFTACAATSGNHGRALAWASMQFGCQCRIYMPESTGVFREEQIRQFGATTVRVPGTYDEAVERAARDAERHSYVLVGNGVQPDSDVLRHNIHGYSTVGEELVSSPLLDTPPTHVFVPAGGGSLAAAVTGRLWMEYGSRRPKVVVVQPHASDSAYQSCLQSKCVPAEGSLATLMDGLSVQELATDAWKILRTGAFAFITIGDDVALQVLKRCHQDRLISVGETGIATIAGFVAAAADSDVRSQLELNGSSRVVLIATEGITDPSVLQSLIGPKICK